jgi:hypothetical protein
MANLDLKGGPFGYTRSLACRSTTTRHTLVMAASINDLVMALPVYELMLVLVGAGLPLSGIWLAHRYETRRSTRALYREKLEAIVEAIYQDARWLDSRATRALSGKEASRDLDFQEEFIDRARMLTSLYYQEELGKELKGVLGVRLACLERQDTVWEELLRDPNKKEEWSHNDRWKTYEPHHSAYLGAVGIFERKAREIIRKTAPSS